MIQIVSHYIRRFLDACRDTVRIAKHGNLVELNGTFIIVKLFIIRFFYSFNFIRNFRKINLKDETLNSEFFIEKKLKISNEIEQIDRLGYSDIYNINHALKKELLDMVLDCKDLDLKKLDHSLTEIFKNKDENLDEYFLRLKQNKVSKITGYLDLKKKSMLKDFLTSKEVLSIVKHYLNSKHISINASFFISNPVETSNKLKHSNAQFFHWDNDFTKFLKLYICLTDIDTDSGPHIYVEKSHKFKKKQHKLCRVFNDNDIYQNYNKIKEFHGKSGSAFFVDSYGLHKAKPPKKRSRILLNIHFGAGKILYSKNDIIINLT